jgi:transcriptional regulator with XRE-family HTH domain
MPARPLIGNKIRAAMERKRMDQNQLARTLGVSRSAVNAWINDRAWPQNSLGALEDILGVTLNSDTSPPRYTEIPAHRKRVLRAAIPDDDQYRKVILVLEGRAELVITHPDEEPDEASGERERPS